MKKQNQTPQSLAPTQVKQSLFESIIANEASQAIDLECQKHANRVGLIMKILYNRELSVLRMSFESKLSELCQDISKQIDHELHSTKED